MEKNDFFNEILNFINPDWEKEIEIKKVCIKYLYFTLLNIPGPYMDVYSDNYDENCAIRCIMYHLFIMDKDQSIFFWRNGKIRFNFDGTFRKKILYFMTYSIERNDVK